jgi:hypothetical protein
MDWVIVDGVRPYDGRYLFDIEGRELTTREWGWIKRLSGYLPLTLEEGFRGGDPELFAAFAVIALYRDGKIDAREATGVFERIVDAPFGSTIRMETDGVDEQEDDAAGPPPPSSVGKPSTSGGGSPTSSETSDETPAAIGTPASELSQSDLIRLAT